MTKRDPIKELAEIIKNNPGCVAIVDNDSWSLHKQNPYECNPYSDGDDWRKAEAWDIDNTLADDSTHGGYDCGYGSGNCYGGDLLQALALIVGIKVESV